MVWYMIIWGSGCALLINIPITYPLREAVIFNHYKIDI